MIKDSDINAILRSIEHCEWALENKRRHVTENPASCALCRNAQRKLNDPYLSDNYVTHLVDECSMLCIMKDSWPNETCCPDEYNEEWYKEVKRRLELKLFEIKEQQSWLKK